MVGGGHIYQGQGLPPRISRRLPGVRLLSVLPVSPKMAASLAGRPGKPLADILIVSTPAPPPPPRLGLILMPDGKGLKIKRVLPDTPAHEAGLAAGDVLLSIDGKPLATPMDIHRAIRSAPFKPHRYKVKRNDRILEMTIVIKHAASSK